MSNTTTKQGQSTVNGLGVNLVAEELEANTTAELDAYLDQQLALQAEIRKMACVGGIPEADWDKLDAYLDAFEMGA